MSNPFSFVSSIQYAGIHELLDLFSFYTFFFKRVVWRMGRLGWFIIFQIEWLWGGFWDSKKSRMRGFCVVKNKDILRPQRTQSCIPSVANSECWFPLDVFWCPYGCGSSSKPRPQCHFRKKSSQFCNHFLLKTPIHHLLLAKAAE